MFHSWLALLAPPRSILVLSCRHRFNSQYLYIIIAYTHVSVTRAVEIPFPICPTWSHFIQDKLEISIYLSWDKYLSLFNSVLLIGLIILNMHVVWKTVWILISWLLQKPADLDLHCFQFSLYIWFHTVFKNVYIWYQPSKG